MEMIEKLDPSDGRYSKIINKVNELVDAVNNQRRAIEATAIWNVQAQTGWSAKDQENIFKILDGTMETEGPDKLEGRTDEKTI